MTDIKYIHSAENIEHLKLNGFFVDWPDSPSPQRHLDILRASHGVELAIDTSTNQVVGFINVISDGIYSAYIPLLEVLPAYQGQGIGKELLNRIVARYHHLYILDACCDESVEEFYASKDFIKVSGMVRRNFESQNAT